MVRRVIYEDRRVPLYVVPGAKPAPAKPAPKPVVRHYPTPTLATLSPQRLALICAFLDGADLARLATTNKFFAAFLGPTPDASDDDAMNALAKHVGSLQPSPSVESIDSLSPMTPRQVHANFWRAILQEHDAFALVLESMNPAASLQNDPRGVYVYMYGYQRKVLRVWERIERRLQHLRSLAEWGATNKSEEWVLPSGYTLDRFQRAFDEWHYEAVVNADIHLQELADEKAGHKGKRGSKMAAKTAPESAEEDEHVVPPEVNIALPAEVMFSIFHRAELDFEHICLALRMDKAKDRPLDRVCKFGPPQVFDYAKGLHTHTDRVEQEQTGKPDPNWHPDYVHCVRLASLIDCEFGQEGLFVNAALDHPNYGKIYLHVSPELGTESITDCARCYCLLLADYGVCTAGPDHIVANSYLEYLEEFEKRLAQAEDKVLPVISSN